MASRSLPATPRGNILVNGGDPGDLTRFDTSGEEGGAVVIRGGHLSLVRVESTTEARTANHTGGGIVVGATDAATLDNVILNTRTSSFPGNISGGAGRVTLTAPSMTASNLTIDTSAETMALRGMWPSMSGVSRHQLYKYLALFMVIALVLPVATCPSMRLETSHFKVAASAPRHSAYGMQGRLRYG